MNMDFPSYLQHDLDTYKECLKTHSPLLDCYWGELYGSINMAEISEGSITPGTCGLSTSEIPMEKKGRMIELIDFTNCKRAYDKARYDLILKPASDRIPLK